MRNYSLSYILITYNRLPVIQKALTNLIAHKKDDDEIIIIDGGSTDGTLPYLQELLARGDIEQFVSERDNGPAHAVNKGMLRARGVLVKHMNDDDEYYLDEIEKCKAFMLEHPDIDVLSSNGINHDGNEYHREEDFLLRKQTSNHTFMMADQGMVIRRSSLALTGLTDPSFIFFDGEFTVRITASKARMAWYTGMTWKHIFTPASLSKTKAKVWKAEAARLRRMYPIYPIHKAWRQYVPTPIRLWIRRLIPKKRLATDEQAHTPTFLF